MNTGMLFRVIGCMILILVLYSCSNDDDSNLICSVEDPVEELAWLNEWVATLSEFEYIRSARYLGDDVFYNINCNPLVNYVSILYDCQGKVIGFTGDFRGQFTNDQLLWLPENSQCSFPVDR